MDQGHGEGDMETIEDVSEESGKLPHDSESSGNILGSKDKSEYHTITVREAARVLENAGIPRTERSIINWCNPNQQGISRLDCYFEPNEKKYFITPLSVDRVAQEELAKGRQSAEGLPNASEDFGNVPKVSETLNRGPDRSAETDANGNKIKELEFKLRDAEIGSRAKDLHIDKLNEERNWFFEKITQASHQIGVLETKLLQLEGPNQGRTAQNEDDIGRIVGNGPPESREQDTSESAPDDTVKEDNGDEPIL